MNKLCYRIVFNKARGLCMVVQEGARSQAKGAGQAGPAGSAAMSEWQGGLATRLRSLALAMLGAFGGSVLLAGLASAQIIADPNAAGRQQATVLNAANGVLQVNAQTPSAAGVSRNVYSRFDVPKTGVVLNNSRTAVQSQLGGWIDANPWMAQGTARVILNEVNSKDPSQLRGYMEIAGSRAEMVIANPAGIVVDGAGFINVSRATLTTGKPLLGEADGALRGYAVRGGMISIEGAGMDARQTDYTALIARSVQLNAGLWAQQLEVTTGVNDITLAADGAPAGNTAAPVAGSGEAPRYGIDASLLGGMYANKITLIGTEAGVGVRNAGAIGAAAGDLVVTSEGRLENTGSLAASLALSAKAKDGVANSGGMSAGGALKLSTAAAVSNSGTISGTGGLQLTADTLSNSNLISSSGRAVLAMQGDVDNSHGVIQAQSLALSSVAGGVNNQSGKLLQSGGVTLDVAAASLHNAGGGQVGAAPASAGADGAGNAGAGTGTGTGADGGAGTGNAGGNVGNGGNGNNGNNGGTGSDAGGASTGVTPPAPIAPGFVRVAGAINNDGGQILSGGGIALSVAALDNIGSQMNLSSLTVNGGTFNNRAGQLNVQRGASIHGTSLDNHSGKLVAGSNVDIQVQNMDNGSGSMSAGGDLLLDSGAIVNRDGKLVSGARAAITASGAVDNHSGQIQAVTGLALNASGKLDNESGAIEAIGVAAALQVRAGEIDNTKGRIVNTGNGASEVGAAGKLLNTGVIGANGALSVAAQTMQNQSGGTVQAAGSIALAVSKQLDNQGSITSGAKLNFDESGATLNNAGQMAAGGDIHIAVLHAANDGGQIGTAAASGASLALSAADISNRGGSLLADRDIGISASQGDLDNSKGLIHGQRDAAVNAAQTLLNQGGVIEAVSANSKLNLDTGAIQNQGGRIVNAGSGDSTVAASGAIVSDGLIAGNGKLAVTAATVSNSGTMSSGGPLNLAVTQQLDNAGLISSAGTLDLGTAKADMRNTGQMFAAGDINVLAHNVANAGQIATTQGSGGNISLHGNALDNHNGNLVASGAVDVQLDGALNNGKGLIQSSRDLAISAKGALDNSAGVIEAIGSTGRMQLNAGAIVNAGGRIANVGTGDTVITADADLQNSGLIAGNGDVKVTSHTLHNGLSGALTSGKDMTLAVEQLLQNDGAIQSGASLVFSKTTSSVGNTGTITADGDLVIKAGNMVNYHGQIATTKAGGRNISIQSLYLSNRYGGILAAGSANVQVAGEVDNREGVVQGAQSLSLKADGALNNSSGALEALGADGRLTVQANGIDNTGGSIVGAGSLGASVSSMSYIWNGGRIAASDKLDMSAATVSNASGASILAGAGLGMSVRDLLDNHGTVSSKGLLNFGLTTAVVNNDAQIVAGGGINLAAGVLNNDKGQISTVKQSQSDVNITANSASNQGGAIVADRNATLAVGGALNNTQGGIQAGKDLQATVGAALNNTKGVMEAVGATSALKVQAGSIDNTDGRIVNVGSGASSVSAQGAILNGGLIAGNGDLTVAAKTLQNNAAATISAGKNLALGVTQQLDNLGAISSTGKLDFTQTTVAVRNSGSIVSGSTATVNAGAFNNDGGQLATVRGSGADVALNAQSLSNRAGVIQSDRNATVGVAYAADNTHGSIQARQDLQFAAGAALNNNSGVIEAISAGSALRVQAGSIDNSAGRIVNVGNAAAAVSAQDAIVNSGLIAGNGSLDLVAGSLQNQAAGKVSSGLAMDVAVTQRLDNQGTITSGGTLEFSKTTAVLNNSSQIVAAGQTHIAAGVLNNDGGQIATLKDSGAGIAIDSVSMSNQGGNVLASGNATLAVAGAVNNAHGTIQAQHDLTLTAVGALNNTSGVIEAATAVSSLTLQAGSIDNSAGRLVNVGTGAATVGAQGLVSNSGLIAGNGTLDLSAGSLRNAAGATVSSAQRMGLGVAQQLDNLGAINSGGTLTFNQATAVVNNSGQIAAAGQATIMAGSLNNDGGLIATLPNSGAGVMVSSQSLSNHGGRVQASGDATFNVGGALDNAQGTLQAGQDLHLNAAGALSNNAGVIEALASGSTMQVQAGSIANGSGRIVNVGTAATTIVAQGGISSSGTIAGNGALDLSAQSLQNSGTVSSARAMTLSLSQLLDNRGAINSGGTLDSLQTTAQVSNSGTITAAGGIAIGAGNLNNDGGQIATLSNSGADIRLDSQSMSNRGGSVLASGNAGVNVYGGLDNARGTLQAGRAMQVSAGGALGNAGGVIEALSAGSTLAVQGQSIDNTSGRMVNVGSGNTTIGSQSSIVSSGVIAGNGNLWLSALTAQNNAGGTLAAGGNLELAVTQQMQSQGTVSSAGTLNFTQSGADFRNSGQMIAGGAATFSAASFNNDGGQIATSSASGADISVTSQSISNRGGKIIASGNTTLSSDAGLDNALGTLQAGQSLKLGAGGALGNAGGTIEADGAVGTLDLTAATFDSSGGRIVNVGSGDTNILIASDMVNSGLIASNGNLNLTAHTLKNNTGGAIGSAKDLLLAVDQQVDNHAAITSSGKLTFQQAGANLNNDGQIVAGGVTTIVAKAINNNKGQIATAKGSGADLTLTANSLSNAQGQILADGKATLTIAGALDNVQGTIQSVKDMQVNATGALTNNGGAIEVAGATAALTLKAKSIDNGNGRIVNVGSGATSVTSTTGVTNAGVIAGGGNLLLSAVTLQNSATGVLASGKDMTLQVTQLLDNQGTVNSAGTLTFNQAGANLNNSGLIVSGGNAVIVANQINNNGGRIGTAAGSDGDLSLTAQQLSNEAGHITTGRDLAVITHVMQGNGELQGGRDLALTMDGDYTQGSGTQQFHSNRDLSLTVTGNIVNNATFEAVGKLTLSGNNVSNNAGAVMQGQGVAVNAAGNLGNAGQINGTATVDLKSGGIIDNSNAIVGGKLTLEAQNLNNTGASTLLGSTGSMALGVAGTVNNTGGASIYSGGGLSIAGALAGGTAGVVNNMSSTIEAAGDLSLNAGSVNNIRENVTLVKVQTVDETKQMSMPSWYHHGDNHNNYDPNSSNYVPSELYYVNPDDVLENQIMFAPDGNAYGRAVIRTHANDSAFFWAASGAYSAQGERLRITMTDGTRELYYMVRRDNQVNPDQGGSTDTPNFLYLGAVNSWHSAPIAYSSQYGNCSTNCVLFETQPQYNDPTSTIIRVTARAVAPQSGKLEQSRIAHHTAEEDQIAPGSGAVAQILSGGNMHLTVGQALNNQYGQIMATGGLAIDGGAAISNQGATLYRSHTFDGTWKTDDGQVVAYTMPSQTEIIGSAAGVISGGKGVSITGRSFSNVDVTAGTAGNIRDSVVVLPTGNNSANAASHATGNGASGGSAGGHVGGSGIGNNAGGAGMVGGSGIANQAAHGAQAGGSGVGNNAALGAQAGDSGLSNQATDAGLAAGSGLGNQAHTRLDTSGSGAYNGARDIDNINASGKASTAATSGPAKGSGASGKALGDVNSGHGASLAQNAAASGAVVKVAPNGLSLLNPNANGSYVFETRPQFANHGDWISSDYLLKALDTDPAVTQKRLGDGFYEQRMVRDQLNQLTGRAPTGGQSDDSRYKELMTSGISFAQQYDLRPGIALSADQISHLTSDIVWMETQTVSLPDGTVENVLVPKVYLAHAGGDAVKANGALVTGDGVSIKTSDSIVNRGGLIDGANGRTVLVAGQDIVNQGGAIKGGAMDLSAGRDVINQSLTVKQEYASSNTRGSYTTLSNQASITASGALAIKAGRDVTDTGGTIAGASVGIGAARDISFNALQTGSTYASQVSGFTEKDSSTTYKVGQVASSGDLKMVAGQDIKLSGTQVAIGATGNGTLVAGRDVSVAAVVNEFNLSKQNDPSSKHYDKEVRQEQNVVGASVAAGGSLTVKAGDSGLGSLAIAGSNLSGGGKVQLVASGDVSITQVQETHLSDLAHHDESSSMFKKSSNTSADYSKIDKVVGSGISGDSVVVKSGNDIVVNGSQLSATQALTLDAGRDLLVSSAQQSDSEKHSEQHQRSGFSFNVASGALGYSKSEQAKAGNSDTVTQVGSVLSGGSVSASSGRDTAIKGSTVVADHDIVIDAKRDLSIVSAENSSDGASSSSSKKSGSIGTTFQPAIGTVKNASDGTSFSVTQVGSQIASLGGNVTLKAGEQYTQTSSEVTVPKGDISIDAKDVLINAAMNSSNSSDHTTYSKTAIGGTVSMPMVDSLKSAGRMISAAQTTNDGRMQALAAVNAAGSVYSAYNAAEGITSIETAGIHVSISLGNQKSDSTVVRASETAVGSKVSAGGSVSINASGAGKDSNLMAIGSDIKAGKDVSLSADNQVNLLAAKDTASQHTTNSSSGASIGVGFNIGASTGFTVDLAVSQARGKADGDDIGYTNSHVTAGSKVNVNSGGDTTLKGGVIAAQTVVADIGGNLNIESLQDSSKFDSKQSSSGLNVSLCIPPFCVGTSTVSGSMSKSHANGDFLSVLEQSGIKAGDGGFQLDVDGKTKLTGGVVSSSDKAIADGVNSLRTAALSASDLANHSNASASSSGFSLSSDMLQTGKYGIAKGVLTNALGSTSDDGSSAGQTRSAVSAGAVTISDETLQKQLTGKTAEEAVASLNRDTAHAHVAAEMQDVQSMKKTVETDQAIKQETIKNVTALTDEAYRSRMVEKPTLYKVECQEASCVNNPNGITKVPTTKDALQSATDVNTVLAINGIFNNAERAAQLAYQNAENIDKTATNPEGNKPKTIFLLHVNEANNSLSELMAVGYEKLISSLDYKTANFLGYTNGAEEYAALLASRGAQPTNSLGHSRGTLLQESAFTILGARPDAAGNFYINPKLTVRGVGGAAGVVGYFEAASKIQGPKRIENSVTFNYFPNDPVATSIFAGANPGNWGLADLWQVYKSSNSMHSCYGSGASGCVQVEAPLSDGPKGTATGNATLIRFVDGKRVTSSVDENKKEQKK
ncbi:hemagglutinin repeat-containing protein [Rugamonas aquatica]|uniref:Filamentous hemagglutinin N-terminal domain-containing protein n=1 Tax=Rugamonas aquatica TaxID=2743357 RepID=A0A6A7NA41_9BURK|nr:hemagglutinin repeat-containing protein [Rugamonas aquatica]MQA41712.1 filamentous hemagglutinin N-terminal domain-containing protein [Rugamonas aquatica]